jgi:CubicO group peptidase (beta-lactamase class C family)
MKTLISLLLFSLSIFGFAQRPPIKDLPAINLEDAGFSQDSLNALDEFIEGFEQNDFTGMVVIKDHQIAIEYFYTNNWRTDINDVRSTGKSFTSLLLGIAIQDGLVENLEQDVYSFFSKEKYPMLHEDYKKVKIKHLLNMASGLDANSDDYETLGHAGRWMGKDEWLTYLLGISQTNKADEKWVYADINAALIGAIIEEKSGMSLKDYADKKVFKPLGITKYFWYTNPANQTVAAGTLFLSTLDFAKLGVLVANAGKWADQQIIPKDYIELLINSKGISEPALASLWDSYSMFWYKTKGSYKGKEIDYLWASGNGGNQLIVIPKEKMVIALTATAYGYRYGHPRTRSVLKKLFNAYESDEK